MFLSVDFQQNKVSLWQVPELRMDFSFFSKGLSSYYDFQKFAKWAVYETNVRCFTNWTNFRKVLSLLLHVFCKAYIGIKFTEV